jgi:hypothetical protein
MSGCLPLEGTENSSSQTKEELNTQNHSIKVIIRPIVRAVDGLGHAHEAKANGMSDSDIAALKLRLIITSY